LKSLKDGSSDDTGISWNNHQLARTIRRIMQKHYNEDKAHALSGLIAAYLLLVEIVKNWFYNLYG
jgi:hypothetical protein